MRSTREALKLFELRLIAQTRRGRSLARGARRRARAGPRRGRSLGGSGLAAEHGAEPDAWGRRAPRGRALGFIVRQLIGGRAGPVGASPPGAFRGSVPGLDGSSAVLSM